MRTTAINDFKHKVLGVLEDGPMTESQISRAIASDCNRRSAVRTVEMLLRQGKIEMEEYQPKKGATAFRYKLKQPSP